MIDRMARPPRVAAPNPDMHLDSSDCNSLPASPGWRRKGEWRWQRPS